MLLKKDEVRLMTQLAIIEKNKSAEEKDVEKYYVSDYVYIHNFKTRIAVSVVYFCYVAAYYFNQIYQHNVNPLVYNIPAELSKVLVTYGVILILFSMLSSAIYKKRYSRVADKNNRYLSLLEGLKRKRGED